MIKEGGGRKGSAFVRGWAAASTPPSLSNKRKTKLMVGIWRAHLCSQKMLIMPS